MVKIQPFVKKLKSILNEPTNKNLITWDEKKYTLVIIKPEEFQLKFYHFTSSIVIFHLLLDN